jgi:hypothetical protein
MSNGLRLKSAFLDIPAGVEFWPDQTGLERKQFKPDRREFCFHSARGDRGGRWRLPRKDQPWWESSVSISTSVLFKCRSDKCNEPPVVHSSLSDTPDYLQYRFRLYRIIYPGAVPTVL